MPKSRSPRYRLRAHVRGLSREELRLRAPYSLVEEFSRSGGRPGFQDADHGRGFKGEPVHEAFARCLHEYLRTHGGMPDLRFEDVAEAVADDARNFWRMGWELVKAAVGDLTEAHALAHCADRTDADHAAWCIYRYFAGHFGLDPFRMPEADAVALAEGIIALPLADFRRWVLAAYDSCPHTVMFAVHERGWRRPTPHRVASSIIVPLTPAAFDRFCGGDCEFFHLAPADFVIPSRHLLIVAVKEWNPPELGTNSEWKLTIARTLVTQLAVLCGDVRELAHRPTLAAYCGTPEGKLRLESFDFEPLGTRSPVKGHPLYVLRPASRGDAMAAYCRKTALNAMTDVCQYRLSTRP